MLDRIGLRVTRRGVLVSLVVALSACSSDEKNGGSGGSGGTGGGGGTGGTVQTGDCTTTLSPSSNDTDIVQTALIEAASGDTICLSPGTYSFTHELSLANHQNVTLKGTGAKPDDVVLDFAAQTAGDDGMNVTADGFTIDNVWIRNTGGNGVTVEADDSHFNHLKVTWDAGSVTSNGAYAVYPTTCNRTIIENTEVVGASDAGIYVGQCHQAIIRNNTVHANVLGIEVENTVGAEVYDNDVYDNAGGILIDLLPNKDAVTESSTTLVRENNVHDNNRENFGTPGEIVAAVPPGTGIMVLAADDVEIRQNTISGHTGVAVIVISYDVVDALLGMQTNDPNTDRYPQRLYIHDNTLTNNGAMPAGVYAAFGRTPLENVVWDGVLGPNTPDEASVQLCLGSAESASFINLGGLGNAPTPDGGVVGDGGSTQSTDASAHQCTLDALPMLTW